MTVIGSPHCQLRCASPHVKIQQELQPRVFSAVIQERHVCLLYQQCTSISLQFQKLKRQECFVFHYIHIFLLFFFNDKIPTLIKYPFNVKHLKILKLLGYSNLWRILKLKALKWFSGIVRGWLFGGLKGLSIFASFDLTGESKSFSLECFKPLCQSV